MTTPETFPKSAVNLAEIGEIAWSNPTHALTKNATSATATMYGTKITNYLYVYDFQFAIPEYARIDGVLLNVIRRRTGGSTGQVRDYVVALRLPTGVNSMNKAATTVNWQTSLTLRQYGSNADARNANLTREMVNDTAFGAVIAVKPPSTSNRIAQVDVMALTVSYTEDVFKPVTNTNGLRHKTRLLSI